MCSHKTQSELLKVADRAIAHYYKRFPFTWRCPQAIDLDLLALELMGSSIKMLPLSKDGSVLGMTAHERLTVRLELADGTVIRDTLLPKDIVVDSSLAGFRNTGARNFTLAHEIGHQLLRAHFPFENLPHELEEEFADIIAMGLLLPECLVRAAMEHFQFPDKLPCICRSHLSEDYLRFKAMARHLGVQRQLLAERMKYLNILTSDVPYRQSLLLLEGG